MRTTTPSPEEMEQYIARFDDLPANKDRTAGKIPPEAREMMTARATRTVIATVTEDTPWGNGVIPGPEYPGTFQYQVNVQFLPGAGGGILDLQQANAVAIHLEDIIRRQCDRGVEAAVGGIVTGQMEQGFGGTQIIDGHQLHLAVTALLQIFV